MEYKITCASKLFDHLKLLFFIFYQLVYWTICQIYFFSLKNTLKHAPFRSTCFLFKSKQESITTFLFSGAQLVWYWHSRHSTVKLHVFKTRTIVAIALACYSRTFHVLFCLPLHIVCHFDPHIHVQPLIQNKIKTLKIPFRSYFN